MSKERALRRAAREAEAAATRAARERATARKARRRQVLRKVTPRLPDRRVGKMFPRRTYRERVIIVAGLIAGVALIWWNFDDLLTRLALTGALIVALPAVVVIAFGRRSG
jgi:hypothetical protein